ncbi:uncharacterized protein DNG_08427 [Cephalotrichum gorgonifer]|uniref:RNase III domain-containing protein n=1 Tax=Cephalotrichum gorgonifer TaxID=2041049 RepID=A0AAE8N6H8_9PEZI|nr:uncharacterized protein DNG_08427 [Cephalotrichum gorgonifer]
MSKRHHKDISDGHDKHLDGKHKRRRSRSEQPIRSSEDATELLKTHASQLTECIQVLNGNVSGASASDAHSALVALSKKLLPAFQVLAGDGVATTAPAKQELDDHSSNARPLESPGQQQQKQLTSPADGTASSTRGLEFIDPMLITPWTVDDIPSSLPPLPPADPQLAEAAFRHQALSTREQLAYDRLEWVGDANIYLLSTYFIFSTFGGLDPGKSSQMRERLVRNQTLAAYFREYDLGTRAKVPGFIKLGEGKDGMKVQGDMFEAYVAAVILSDHERGPARAVTWLKALWARTIADDIRRAEKMPETQRVQELGQDRSETEAGTAKLRLNQALRVPGVELIYEDVPTKQKNKANKSPMFSVKLFLRGWGEQKKELGWGTSVSKKEAGQKAAVMALANKKLMAVYVARKKAYVEEMAKTGKGAAAAAATEEG